MKIRYYDDDFPYIIIDDVYTEKECEMILADYDRINEKGKLLSPDYTGAASHNGKIIKNGKAAFYGESIDQNDFTQSGISLLSDQSPPPSTLPALATPILTLPFFGKYDLIYDWIINSADAFEAL